MTAAVIGIAIVALGLVLTPGPNMIYLVSRTLAQGRTAGLISLLGVAAGFLVYLAGSAIGLTALFATVPVLYTILKFAGAGYLLYLAWQTLRGDKAIFVTAAPTSARAKQRAASPPAEPTIVPDHPANEDPCLPDDRIPNAGGGNAKPDSPRRLFTMGMVTNLLNPKIAVLYVSLLPQFIDPARGNVAAQGLTLGLVQIAIALTVNCLIVLSAGQIARWLSRKPAWLRVQRWFMAGVLGVLAVRLVIDRGRAAPLAS